MSDHIKEIFNKYSGIMRTSQMIDEGFYYKKIKNLLDSGVIIQIRRGYYQYADDNDYSDIPLIATLFPDGILCMETALYYYGYSDRTPSAWHLAVTNTSTRTRFRIEYPKIRPHFIKEKYYQIGLRKINIDMHTISMYDRERTICDLMLHRNKIDPETFNTAVKRYIEDANRSTAKLMEYAKKLRVERKVNEVLSIWL